MEKWNRILKSNVVNTFRNASYTWWGMDIHFYDEYGNYKNNGISFQNPFCRLIQSRSKEAKKCLLFRKKNLKGFNKSCKIFTCKCNAGLQNIAVPIFVNGDYIGALIGSGMHLHISNDQKEKDIVELTGLGFDKTELKKYYNTTIVVNSHTKAYILDFMKLVAKDVEAFYEMLYEMEETKKKQTLLLNRNYREKYKSIIGNSPSMRKVYDTLDLIESTEGSVLIIGETGTGKELIATTIHYNSVRKNKAFIIQSCSAFSDTILSSELFGHEKGAFTGAVSDKKGLFEMADGGTLFLDEIGDLGIDVQGKLLRVLENGTFYRVGSTVERAVDVRIITATNKDLSKMVEKGLFRRDLIFRINTLQIKMPPLRERKSDIEPLFHSFLDHYADKNNIWGKRLNPDLIKILSDHDWTGNVRELKNVVESLLAMSSNSATIEPEHLLLEVIKTTSKELSIIDHFVGKKLQDALRSTDKGMTIIALQKADWNKTRAACALGISRSSLNRRIEKHLISKETI